MNFSKNQSRLDVGDQFFGVMFLGNQEGVEDFASKTLKFGLEKIRQ